MVCLLLGLLSFTLFLLSFVLSSLFSFSRLLFSLLSSLPLPLSTTERAGADDQDPCSSGSSSTSTLSLSATPGVVNKKLLSNNNSANAINDNSSGSTDASSGDQQLALSQSALDIINFTSSAPSRAARRRRGRASDEENKPLSKIAIGTSGAVARVVGKRIF